MVKNWLIVAFRNLFLKKKFLSFINIGGLALGISASLIIYLIVHHEFTFDRIEQPNGRIYRVVSNFDYTDASFKSGGVVSPLAGVALQEIPGIVKVAPFRFWRNNIAKVSIPDAGGGQPVTFKNQDKVVFADARYFSVIPRRWLYGSAESALQQPNAVVLSAACAKKYYPSLSSSMVVGRTLLFNDTIPFTITGIVADAAYNTDFDFNTFVSFATLKQAALKPDDWDNWGTTNPESQLLVELSTHTSTGQVMQQLSGLLKKYHNGLAGKAETTTLLLQPLGDAHFNADYAFFNQRTAHKPTLYGLSAAGIFLLCLACINFINLSTAQASQRSKEIGIRKTLGSSKKQLMAQFLGETFLISCLSGLLSLALLPLLLHAFSGFIPAGLQVHMFNQPGLLVFLAILIVLISLLAGFYPALVLSAFPPVSVMKQAGFAGKGRPATGVLRRSLTIFQFVIAQVFVICTLLVSKQLHFVLSEQMGFKKDAVVYFGTNWNDKDPNHRFVLLHKLKAIPEIGLVSLSNNQPVSEANRGGTIGLNDGHNMVETHVLVKLADTNYIHVYQMTLLAGNNLPHSDTINSLLINETGLRALGFQDPQQAIGKLLDWEKRKVPVAGVLKDFHQHSFHESIQPLVLSSKDGDQLTFNVSLRVREATGDAYRITLPKIEKAFHDVYPNDDFVPTFVDESIERFYTADLRISHLLMWIAALSIFISCLGLMGLVIYVTDQRTKEIGIRKVVGATVRQIVALLSADFLKPVISACLIALPIAWFAGNRWLNGFAYRTTQSWWLFLAGSLTLVVAAFCVLSIKTIKAACENPVKSLRTS